MVKSLEFTSVAPAYAVVQRGIQQGKSAEQIRADLLKRLSSAYAARKAIQPGRVR